MTGEPFFWGMPKLADPHWDRLWAMTQEAGLSVNFHIGSGDMSIFERAYEGAGEHANYAGFGVQFGIGNVSVIANLITGGVCHRFPEQKFVSVESGVGWIPFALHHLDWQWLNCGVPQEHPEYDLLPSEYFKRQMYGCFWFENDTVKAAIEQMGPGCFMYESDFPHPTSMAPGPGDRCRRAPPVHRRGARRPPGGRPARRPPRQRRQALPPRLSMTTSTSLLGLGDELPKALANYFDALDDGRLDEASEAYAQDVLYAVPPAGRIETDPRSVSNGRATVRERFERRGPKPYVHEILLCMVEGRDAILEGLTRNRSTGAPLSSFASSLQVDDQGLVCRYLAFQCAPEITPLPADANGSWRTPGAAIDKVHEYFDALDDSRFEDAADCFSPDTLLLAPAVQGPDGRWAGSGRVQGADGADGGVPSTRRAADRPPHCVLGPARAAPAARGRRRGRRRLPPRFVRVEPDARRRWADPPVRLLVHATGHRSALSLVASSSTDLARDLTRRAQRQPFRRATHRRRRPGWPR